MSSCPLCKSTILQYAISLHAEFTMCSNEDCVYPFQDEKICQTSIIDKRGAGAQGINRKRKATAPPAFPDLKAKISGASTTAIKKRKAVVVGSSAPIPSRKIVTATPLSPLSPVISTQPALPIRKPSISTTATSASAPATAAMGSTAKKAVKAPKAATASSTVAAIPKNYAATTPSNITTAIPANYASTHAATTATASTTATAIPMDFTTSPATIAATAIPTNFVVSSAATTTTAIPASIATAPAITTATASMPMSAIPESGLSEHLFALAAPSTTEATASTTGIAQATPSSNSSIPTSPIEALPDLTFDFLPSESWTTPVTPPDILLQLDNTSKVLDPQTEVSATKLEDLLFDDEFYNDFGNIEGSTVQPEFDADFEAMLQQQF
ncbi:hypothetical protein BG011_002121 [Mortierella polycephala]|uniref:Uncharacterized protein n=1 Tax=Mortierella polycephala TaxID=41804 RepID=A0A9P6U4D3_9FUNG|nr:hypothetical protein BG011_002121 [Mortierella polycephala]